MHNHSAIILFDGVCNLCNSSVNFVIKHDKKNYFKFASLQSEIGKELLKKFNCENFPMDSFVLIKKNKLYKKSTAAINITKHLNGLYPLLYVFVLIPPFIRNYIYMIISRNRYKWFGKRKSCMIPTKEIKSKFLD